MAREWRKVSPAQAKVHPLYGVKNWLAVFAFGVLLVPMREFGGLNSEAHGLGLTVSQLMDADASFKTWVTLVLATEVAVVVAIFGLMFAKSPHFRIATSAVWIAFFPVVVVFALLTEAPGSGQAVGFGFFQWVISCLLWVTYLQRSRRVRVTFEHCVLAADLMSSSSAMPAQSAILSPVADARRFSTTPPLFAASAPQAPARRIEIAHVSSATGERTMSSAAGDKEEALWAQALDELNGTGRRQGLWAKAFAHASGNESAAQAQYLNERVQQLAEQRVSESRAEAERLAERGRSEERTRQEVAQRASAARADFTSGKRLSPKDVALLVKAIEVDPNLLELTDRFRGETLLHWSARYGLRAEAAALIGRGANADAPNGDGRRPYELTEDLELKGILRSAAFGGRPA
jgi:hypothetical protein